MSKIQDTSRSLSPIKVSNLLVPSSVKYKCKKSCRVNWLKRPGRALVLRSLCESIAYYFSGEWIETENTP